ncbi:hypothetical protein RJ640_023596 [Escallonia rubra]|uniref:Uncharacterized protein n=1 Tax=Escallonia rubra TaxID=112253 RepID=A0AA88UKB9_9ASTE|nr:hypothetical protein RJ640_023596 [Escallonia rubra]
MADIHVEDSRRDTTSAKKLSEMVKRDVADDDRAIEEWKAAISGEQKIGGVLNEKRRRIIHRISPLLRANKSNEKEYDPVVVSLGPYHHNKGELQLAEKFKPRTLRMFLAHCFNKTIDDLCEVVLAMVDIARSSYVEGSTDAYDDEEFSRMMLLDACFILSVICGDTFQTENTDCDPFTPSLVAMDNMMVDPVVLQYHEHLGALGWANIFRDMFLLENQVPYEVLRVLINFTFDIGNEREATMNRFVDFIVHRQRTSQPEGRTLSTSISQRQPSHLLEMYRTSFLRFDSNQKHSPKAKFRVDGKNRFTNYTHSCRSATELKAKGINFSPSTGKSLTDIDFNSFDFFGKLEIPSRVITPSAKAIFLNLIAYEMSPHNPNDFSVTSYIGFMKSLINHPADVKMLRSNRILLNKLNSDEELAKMYMEISIPTVNNAIFMNVQERIQEYYNSRAKTWIAQMISRYLSSPWTAIGLLAATLLLVLTFLQTYFTISPRSRKIGFLLFLMQPKVDAPRLLDFEATSLQGLIQGQYGTNNYSPFILRPVRPEVVINEYPSHITATPKLTTSQDYTSKLKGIEGNDEVHYEDHRGAGSTSIEKLTEMIKINVVDDRDTIREWEAAIRGEQRHTGVANEKKRRIIHKISPLLRTDKSNEKEYDPRTSKPEGSTLGTSISQRRPSHLLEMYRTSFLKCTSNQESSRKFEFRFDGEREYIKYTHSCRSATELKAKGINFAPNTGKSLTDIGFNSFGFYGQLEIPPRVIIPSAKAIFLNLIAYEMCPHTPNDFSVTSYIGFMKSLINHPNDVKPLRSNHILLNKLNSDEELAKLYAEISIPTVNNSIFMSVQERMQEHYNSRAKTWMAQVISRHLSSPWAAIALIAATLILVLTFIQTYFTISPRSS